MEDRGDTSRRRPEHSPRRSGPMRDDVTSVPSEKHFTILIPRRVAVGQNVGSRTCSIWKRLSATARTTTTVISRSAFLRLLAAAKQPAIPIAKIGSVSTKPRWPKLPPNCQSHQLAMMYVSTARNRIAGRTNARAEWPERVRHDEAGTANQQHRRPEEEPLLDAEQHLNEMRRREGETRDPRTN